MIKDELTINGKPAWKTWGACFTTQSLAQLLTPAPMKAYVENSSRMHDGKWVYTGENGSEAKVDSVEMNLELHIIGKDNDDFIFLFRNFCDELYTGVLKIATAYTQEKTYIYKGCQTLSVWNGLGRIMLRLEDINPRNSVD